MKMLKWENPSQWLHTHIQEYPRAPRAWHEKLQKNKGERRSKEDVLLLHTHSLCLNQLQPRHLMFVLLLRNSLQDQGSPEATGDLAPSQDEMVPAFLVTQNVKHRTLIDILSYAILINLGSREPNAIFVHYTPVQKTISPFPILPSSCPPSFRHSHTEGKMPQASQCLAITDTAISPGWQWLIALLRKEEYFKM